MGFDFLYLKCGIWKLKNIFIPQLRYKQKTKWRYIPQLRYMENWRQFYEVFGFFCIYIASEKTLLLKIAQYNFFSVDRIFWKWFPFNMKYFSSCDSLVQLPTRALRVNYNLLQAKWNFYFVLPQLQDIPDWNPDLWAYKLKWCLETSNILAMNG